MTQVIYSQIVDFELLLLLSFNAHKFNIGGLWSEPLEKEEMIFGETLEAHFRSVDTTANGSIVLPYTIHVEH